MNGKPTTFTTWKTPTTNTTPLFLSFLEKKQIHLKAKLTQIRRRSFIMIARDGKAGTSQATNAERLAFRYSIRDNFIRVIIF